MTKTVMRSIEFYPDSSAPLRVEAVLQDGKLQRVAIGEGVGDEVDFILEIDAQGYIMVFNNNDADVSVNPDLHREERGEGLLP